MKILDVDCRESMVAFMRVMTILSSPWDMMSVKILLGTYGFSFHIIYEQPTTVLYSPNLATPSFFHC